MLLFSVEVTQEVIIFLPWYLLLSFYLEALIFFSPVLACYLLDEILRVYITRFEFSPSPYMKRVLFDSFVWIGFDAQYQKALLIQIV